MAISVVYEQGGSIDSMMTTKADYSLVWAQVETFASLLGLAAANFIIISTIRWLCLDVSKI